MSRCVTCGARKSGLFTRCAPCVDVYLATLAGETAGRYTALLLSDDAPARGSLRYAEARSMLRLCRGIFS
jgi:hypothetical protein